MCLRVQIQIHRFRREIFVSENYMRRLHTRNVYTDPKNDIPSNILPLNTVHIHIFIYTTSVFINCMGNGYNIII